MEETFKLDISKEIKDIKYMLQFIDESLERMDTGNLSHKKSGISNAVQQINKILKEIEVKNE